MFDESRLSEAEVKDRLDAIIESEFTDVADVHTRWISNLADSPLFGAAATTIIASPLCAGQDGSQ
jgi:hypothetical protein